MYKKLKVPIVGISGKIGSGKDTVGDILTEHNTFIKKSFAGALKKKAMEDFNLTEAQVYDPKLKEVITAEYGKSPRELLQLMGTEWYRSIDPDYWIKELYKTLLPLDELYESLFHLEAPVRSEISICISDVRFPNEVDFIKAIGGINIRVIRPGYNQTIHSQHESEMALDNIDMPITIVNDGTIEELKTKVQSFINGAVYKSLGIAVGTK